ncbi:MAG: hypothetical protein M1830_000921 [Pleopsidium flavum]|nr:MAG: hypothetical protein M1830_000921 [Pleopsidium flavum]
MASSPPASPSGLPQRPVSAMIRAPRSSSRMSMSSKQGGGSRASDEDVKTSVQVAVRVRPPLNSTDPGFDLIPQRFQRSMVQVTSPTSLAVDSPQGRKLFVFDRVFGEDVDQQGIWEYLDESVNAFVQGYNVSVLAYGQSGAGKSYTMGTSGPAEQSDPRNMGVIPRAAGVLFEKLPGLPSLIRNGPSGLRTPTRYSSSSVQTLQSLAKASAEKGWQMTATYVEIYNEQLRDLLVPESVPQGERSTVTIREDTKGRILLTGLHQVTINSIEDLLGALNFGSSIRQTDATAINAKSSRSHAVLSLNLIQRKNKLQQTPNQEKRFSVPVEAMSGTDSWVTVDSKLHFVDLAGSERMKNTGASGERAKEGISINAGLASLGKVISQLSSRQAGSHVSYRDSRLTRLLQDSLGGNAITYMIACVTPAEFHLSETLNTVQYAQRARAIQSKPHIQQVSDESDKQAVIDRLRAEVSFLREQIRNSERGDRRSNIPQERAERQNEREVELQNHLLDIQENYSALSQRHAKLISEITKARDGDSSDTPTLNGALGDSAVERLKRSNSFAEAVEQVVLEYEKTIQSLETSLSNTRSSLSSTESNLLEKETKCAYIETVNQQLQTRVQKMMDRESSTEHYLHDLEAKLDGHSSGEEKNSAIIVELRKEIARVRENEAGCEDYITTLEERLAEADQDMELMQREVDRLEHVVERQRSVGKLDNLLYELDHIQQNGKKFDDQPLTSGHPIGGSKVAHERGVAQRTLREAADTAIPESDDENEDHPPLMSPESKQALRKDGTRESQDVLKKEEVVASTPDRVPTENLVPQSPAQSKFVADKLEDVTQELFDLHVEHESTVNDYDMLSAKYEEALRTLAELQDAVDEARHPAALPIVASPASTRPTSFLGDARVNELKGGGHLSSSRSLSSELSLAGESPTTAEPSDVETVIKNSDSGDVARVLRKEETLAQDMEHLKNLQAEKEEGMLVLTVQYAQLQDQHLETLDVVEELKAEVHKAKMSGPTSPTSPVVRRKSSQTLMAIDRAHRSLASLRNIAAENFEDKPDTMQNFELNLNTAMHELHSRSERVQVLEAEIAGIKKEMETKMTIISGLTRERSSMKGSSPMDISVVSSMRDQLLQSESQIRTLHESYAAREKELLAELQTLKDSLTTHVASSSMPGIFPETPLPDLSSSKQLGEGIQTGVQEQKIVEMQEALSGWETRHQSAIELMQASEKKLLTTIAELEAEMGRVEAMRVERSDVHAGEKEVATADLQQERSRHHEVVTSLQVEIDEHNATISAQSHRTAELELSLMAAREQLEESISSNGVKENELDEQRQAVSQLESKTQEHQSQVEFYKHGLMSLHNSHDRELQDFRKSTAAAQVDTETRLAKQASIHNDAIMSLQHELSHAKNEMTELLAGAAAILKEDTAIGTLQSQIHKLNESKTDLVAKHAEASSKLGVAEEDRTKVEEQTERLRTTVTDLTAVNKATVKELEIVSEKEKKSSRLVDELEEQIAANFDQHQAATNRLSVIQSQRNQAADEANAARLKLEEEIEIYRSRCGQLEAQLKSNSPHPDGSQPRDRSNSMTSNLRKSASVASLPSPPPVIPLPPLPTMANGNTANGPSPTNSRHASKDLANAQLAEDQEARIRTIEKHLYAEKQLTATLEEALVDLETQGNKVKMDMEAWKRKAWSYEDEITSLRKERNSSRYSLQAVEEERNARREAEAARAHLEERMNAINKKKKKSALNCF